MFALLIGINKYQDEDNILPLKAAVADAEKMKRLLLSLGAADRNIVTLFNKDATRSAILDELTELANNNQIQHDDPILIYFAGHGSEVAVPNGWPTPNGKLQVILPYDCISNNRNLSEGEGQAIFDVVLGQHIREIARNKGTNIVDTCHSGSGTRDAIMPEVRIRGTNLGNHELYDRDIRRHTHLEGLANHVLLAASASGGQAYEDDDSGHFTAAIIKIISNSGISMTSADLIRRIPPMTPRQNPRCESTHCDRLLFTSDAYMNRKLFIVVFQNESHRYVLKAGEVNGIVVDDVFNVYVDKGLCREGFYGVFTVESSGVAESYLKPAPGYNPRQPSCRFGFARQQKGKGKRLSLHHYSALQFPEWFTKQMSIDEDYELCPLLESKPGNGPHLIVETDGNEIRFQAVDDTSFPSLDRIIAKFHSFHPSFHRPSSDDQVSQEVCSKKLPRVLSTAAGFFWNLCRQPTLEFYHSSLEQFVQLGCFELDNFLRKPIGANLAKDWAITINNTRATYGFNIRVSKECPGSLFCALFYFDVYKLEIVKIYHPPVTATCNSVPEEDPDTCIRPGGYLHIGYGNTGWSPLGFSIREGQEVDVGYLVLYISTTYTDCEHIGEPSPFTDTPATGGRSYQSRGLKFVPSTERSDFWTKKRIPVVVKGGT
ncbi:hypothetical protein VKT23_006518 [Stygiomarasmius scandens]|uniref:Peptidase C14 caspase domain-containing protein n=1 Tax=Marasmiellus scandens TaxID=2682957 RepID=A0ABR1JUC2_9AGAR